MSITVGQRYTRASDKAQQEANVTVSIDSVRVDKEGQILEVPVIKAASGQKTYFKEVTGLVRDLLEGSPHGLSFRFPYAILTADSLDAGDTLVKLYNPTDLDALQVEAGDFLVIIKNFGVDPTVDLEALGGYRHLYVTEILSNPPPQAYSVGVQMPVPGSVPSYANIDANFPIGSILINLSKIKLDSCLGDEGQFGVKTQLEQPAVPVFSAEPGVNQIDLTITESEDQAVLLYEAYVRQGAPNPKPSALTPDMVPDLVVPAYNFSGGQWTGSLTTFNGGTLGGGGDIVGSEPYWVILVAKALKTDPGGTTPTSFTFKYDGIPSDPSEPVSVTPTLS